MAANLSKSCLVRVFWLSFLLDFVELSCKMLFFTEKRPIVEKIFGDYEFFLFLCKRLK